MTVQSFNQCCIVGHLDYVQVLPIVDYNIYYLRIKIPVENDMNILNLLIHVARFPIREVVLI